MVRFALAALVALLLPMAPAPAHAEVGDPRVSLAWSATDVGDGSGRYLVSAVCGAVVPEAALVITLCAIDATYNETRTPAPVGVTTIQGSAGLPYRVCAYAAFIRHDLSVGYAPPICAFHPDTESGWDTRAVVYTKLGTGRHETDSRPGQYVWVTTPYSVPELLTLVCDSVPYWLRPWCML